MSITEYEAMVLRELGDPTGAELDELTEDWSEDELEAWARALVEGAPPEDRADWMAGDEDDLIEAEFEDDEDEEGDGEGEDDEW